MLALARRFFAGRPVAQAVAVFTALNLLMLLIFTLLVPSRPIVLPVEVPILKPGEVALRVGLVLAVYACVLWALRPGQRHFGEFLLLGGVGIATVWTLTQYYLPLLALGLVPVVARYWLSLRWTLLVAAALVALSGWWSLREPLQLTLEVTFTQGPSGSVTWSALPQGTDYPNIETSFFVFMAMLFAGYSLFALEVLIRESQARMALESTQRKLEEKSRQAGVLEERQRLAREIHDTLAQNFTSIVMHLEAAEAAITGELTPVAATAPAGRAESLVSPRSGVEPPPGRSLTSESGSLNQVRAYLDQARATA
ncbi:MAG: sensor histidine kinase, partial [Meiothermus silvanus]|nr:sensor histidine kinase [Allomeiothermus silvanus]